MNTTQIRQRLEARKHELLHRLGKVGDDARHKSGLDPDFEEQAVQRENDDVLENLDDAIRLELGQIAHALHRIDQSSYGTCEVCNRPIATDRLKALPYATRCIACEGMAAARSQ
jgi:RNA polymerase-binding transcription factor